jgi:hypothetical protein
MSSPKPPHTDIRAQSRASRSSDSETKFDAPILEQRRRLLKAAASAAPLVATLPGGEALANSSAMQCVINEQQHSPGPATPFVSDPRPEGDTYLRVPGIVQTWASSIGYSNGGPGQGLVQVFYFPDTTTGDAPIWLVGQPQSGVTDPAPFGTWFNRSLPGVSHQPALDVDALFLRMYDVNSAGDVAIDGSTMLPTDCTISSPAWPGGATSPTGPQPPPKYCYYPMAVQAPRDAIGNVPLTLSCIGSFTTS